MQAALSYIACNGEGEFVCRANDCWCKCNPKFPECNCPYMDIQAMEESLQRITETWGMLYKDFEDSGKRRKKRSGGGDYLQGLHQPWPGVTGRGRHCLHHAGLCAPYFSLPARRIFSVITHERELQIPDHTLHLSMIYWLWPCVFTILLPPSRIQPYS